MFRSFRRRAVAGFTSLIALTAFAAPHPALAEPATAASTEELRFPSFTYQGPLFDHAALLHNPTNEWDFPTIFHAGAHLEDPLGEYYLYTAPHSNPGGISLFYSDSIGGPWTEHAENPVIARVWPDIFQVSHVSSPHAIWIDDEDQLFLYFHGENSQTRLASSTDGVDFTYEKVVIDRHRVGPEVTETSYARVYEMEIPGRGNRYFMTFMDAVPGDGLGNRTRRIRLALSDDARTWSVDPEPLVTPFDATGPSLSGAQYLTWRDDGNFIAYHGAAGNIFVTDVGPNFDRQDHLGILYRSGLADQFRAASPAFVAEGDTLHMIYESGLRNRSTLAHATADLTAPGTMLEFDPAEPEATPPDPEPEPAIFNDVSRTSSHYPAIEILGTTGLTRGCNGAGTRYCPDEPVTRAEMATFLMRSKPLPANQSSTRFRDVRADSSHVPGIAAIDRAEYTEGCGNNNYCPRRDVTRGEMATFLARANGLTPRPGVARYQDVPASSSHAPAIEAIARAGYTQGCGGGRFCPDRPVTRAEMATFLVRAFRL